MKHHSKRLLDRVRDAIRLKGYSVRTEEAYADWIKRFILFHDKRHPQEMGYSDVRAFLLHLATKEGVAASTQNQALNALLFLYREVLEKDLDGPIKAIRAKSAKRVPTVLTRQEALAVIERLSDTYRLAAQLLYGSGLRLMECMRLRVGDLDLPGRQIVVRNSEGARDRVTVLPDSVIPALQRHLQGVKRLHDQDLAKGLGCVDLPPALQREHPNANGEMDADVSIRWQYVFPSKRLSVAPHTSRVRRHHLDPSGLRKAIREAARSAGIPKRVTPQTLRHSFAVHLLESGYNVRLVQELLGHRDVRTTMIYTHLLRQGKPAVRSPLDDLR
ncbi:MAG: integron integrase [Chloroflexi bacterium]|nr:integron integrase [Chloroflexota bacterium]